MSDITEKVRAQLLLPKGAFKTKAARSLGVDLLFHAEQLEAENARLEANLQAFRSATCANCGAGPSTPGEQTDD